MLRVLRVRWWAWGRRSAGVLGAWWTSRLRRGGLPMVLRLRRCAVDRSLALDGSSTLLHLLLQLLLFEDVHLARVGVVCAWSGTVWERRRSTLLGVGARQGDGRLRICPGEVHDERISFAHCLVVARTRR